MTFANVQQEFKAGGRVHHGEPCIISAQCVAAAAMKEDDNPKLVSRHGCNSYAERVPANASTEAEHTPIPKSRTSPPASLTLSAWQASCTEQPSRPPMI